MRDTRLCDLLSHGLPHFVYCLPSNMKCNIEENNNGYRVHMCKVVFAKIFAAIFLLSL